jgi:hypothetical protein
VARWVAPWVVLWISACGFSAQPAGGKGDASPLVDAAVDTPPPITCGDLRCDPNATCTTTGAAACECKRGYAGDGMTCRDVDECTMNNGGCPAACMNTPGSAVCYAPASCADVKARVPAAADGPFTLYLGGDAGKPWTAFCAHMATTPVEYLSLQGNNSAQYTAGGGSPGMSVRTTYTKVRFDPAALRIDIRDRAYATSQGTLNHSGEGTMVTSMPFAVAMDCLGNKSNAGVASIDLTGTPFALVNANQFARGGNMSDGAVALSSNNQRATLTGGGNCGWLAPNGAPINPFNDNVTDGALLVVKYQP